MDFKLRGVPVRLSITDSLFLGYHSFAEPLSRALGPPHGDPLNPLFGIERLGDESNRLPLTRAGAGQAYGDLFHRFNLLLSVWRLQAGLRVDTSLFLAAPTPEGGCGVTCLSRYENRWVSPGGLEKLFVTYTDRDLEISLGDVYAVFGRGLVLSVRKVDELGIDTTLRGARIVYNPGSAKLSLVGGVSNIQNVDEATGRFEHDPVDVILGARAEARLFDRLILGVHAAGGIFYRPGRTEVTRDDMDPTPCDPEHLERCPFSTGRLGYGLSLDAPRILPWLDLYVEVAGLRQLRDRRLYPSRAESGYAFYASLTLYGGPLTVLFEGKQYSRFETFSGSTRQFEFYNIAYNLPPTVERVLTEVEDPQTEIGGGRVHLTYRLSAAVSFIISDAGFRQGRYADLVTHALTIHDPYAGIMLRWQGGVSHLFVNAGYRYEYDDAGDQVFKTTAWFDWDIIQGLPRNMSLESQGRALFRYRAGEAGWTEGNAYLALKWTPYLIGALGLEWSTREQTINEHDGTFPRYAYFPSGFVQYNITTRSSIRLFAGGQRGGLKCVSGVCRVYPEFRGARLEVVLRF